MVESTGRAVSHPRPRLPGSRVRGEPPTWRTGAATSDENVIEDIAGLDRLTPGEWVIDAEGDALCLADTHLGGPQRIGMPKAVKGRVGLVASLEHARIPVALAEIDPEYVCKHNHGVNERGHCYLCGAVVGEASPRYFDAPTLEVVREAGRLNAAADAVDDA